MHLPPEYFVFTGIFVLGLISPGPDFALVTRNSLLYSSAIGRWSALGIALGILVHVTYCLLGIGLLIEKSILLFSVLKYIGAAYLIYLGVKALLHRGLAGKEASVAHPVMGKISSGQAVRMGFMTNALNPKVTVLFVSLFSQVVGPHTSSFIKLIYGFEMFFFTLAWFLALATVFAKIASTRLAGKVLKYVGRVTGVMLIGFGARLAFTGSR